MNLGEVRTKLGAVLAPVADTDPDVLTSLVDAIEPPALILGWGDPWLEPDTACFSKGLIVITCVASRLAPGDGIGQLEELVVYTLDRLKADTGDWPLEQVGGPSMFTLAKTNYLAARVTVRVLVT